MIGWILAIVFGLLFLVTSYYLIKFIKIIFIFEDDLDDAIEALQDAESTLDKVFGLKLYFDDKNILSVYSDALAAVRVSKLAIMKIIRRFTERSQHKYVIYEEKPEQDTTSQTS